MSPTAAIFSTTGLNARGYEEKNKEKGSSKSRSTGSQG